MAELVIPQKRYKPITFRRVLTSQGVIIQAALPQRQPHNLRTNQALQILDLKTHAPVVNSGRPKVFGYSALQTMTQSLVYEDVAAAAAAGDPDSEVLQVFMDFIQAVDEQLPMGLRELCSRQGVDVVAAAAGMSANQLLSRLQGRTKMTLDELYKIYQRFPAIDLETAFLDMLHPSVAD